jgi:ribulose-phosphate 3-epimerase
MKIKIAPSILSADFGSLNEDIKTVQPFVDLLHVDVMDGHFVPNLTFGAPVIRCIKTTLPLSCHLMIENPEKYIEDFVKAGAATITFHAETVSDMSVLIKKIHALGVRAGVSVNPETDVKVIENVLNEVDEVLVMSVHPGFGGQKFIETALEKIKWLREKRSDLDIAVDGGIDDLTAPKVLQAGANILVSGSYIFKAADREAAINKLRS